MSEYTFFSKDPAWWGEAFQSIWGCHDICPLLRSFHTASITQVELSSLTSLRVWDDPQKSKSKVAFLLILTGGCTEGDRVFGLSMMWVHLYQAKAPTMGDMVKWLTPLPFTGPDCPYAFVWLNGDACHVPLPKEGHLRIQVIGSTSNAACRRVSHLQVCQLLSSGSQVVYPVGLNGGEVPMIASPPDPMAKGVNLLSSDPIYLKMDIPQPTTEESEFKALPLSGCPPSILITSPIRPPPPKAKVEVSMTMEVRELLFQVALDTSEHASGSSTPKRHEPMVLVMPLPTKLEDFPNPVYTSSQVSAPNNAEMEDASLEEIPTLSSLTVEPSEPSSDALPQMWFISRKSPTRL